MGDMKAIVICEESGALRDELENLGHNAWSVDFLPTSSDQTRKSGKHIQDNLFNVIYHEHWDAMFAFYPCYALTVAGARWYYEKRAAQYKSVKESMQIMNAPIEKISFENPIGVLSTFIRKPDQIIQPWQFGHKEVKATCLWLKNLPLLVPTDIVGPPPQDKEEKKKWEKVHRMAPGPQRSILRSKTYKGVATAMAQQWAQV